MAAQITSHTNSCILILSGLPGCGKSCLSHKLSRWLYESKDYVSVVIEYDELMSAEVETSLIEQESDEKKLWKKYREDIVQCVDYLILKKCKQLNSSLNLSSIDTLLIQKFRECMQRQICSESVDTGSSSEKNSLCAGQLPVDKFTSSKDRCQSSADKDSKMILNTTPGSSFRVTPGNDEQYEASVLDSVLEQFCFARQEPLVVIIDDNMYYRSMRYDYYQLARMHSIGFCQIHIDCPVEIALERNHNRKKSFVDPLVIKKMYEKMQIPDSKAYSWEKYSFLTDESLKNLSKSELMHLVTVALSDPVQPIQEINPEIITESRRICSVNMIHQADLILRQLIAEQMIKAKKNGVVKVEMKNLAGWLAQQKAKILTTVTQGELTIDNDTFINNASKHKSNPFFKIITQTFNKAIEDKASIGNEKT